MQTVQQMKRLTKIRLINWHYFTDETIHVKGSVLFSGENASGKSTVLDAIQLVLTTNTRRFNPAANEKSKRNLEGYVRCKTGDEGNAFVRGTGAVISYVALEFYEESRDRYFVLGVKLDSPEPGAEVNKKWFLAEGEMNSLSFIVNGKPASDREFTQNGRKVPFETVVNRARDNFKIRLGSLDENFQDMIIKSMAFKPMDRVKDFINKFILPEKNVKTENLQENIRNLREMQKLINEVKLQISQLKEILEKADEINDIDHKLLVVELLMKIAEAEKLRAALEELKNRAESDETKLSVLKQQQLSAEENCRKAQDRCDELRLALNSNEYGQLIREIEKRLQEARFTSEKLGRDAEEYEEQLRKMEAACRETDGMELPGQTTGTESSVSGKELLSAVRVLSRRDGDISEKSETLEHLKRKLNDCRDLAYRKLQEKTQKKEELQKRLRELEAKIRELRQNRLVYDENTTRLLKAVNEEFSARNIDTEARIFAELLEIERPQWRDAAEGYLNTQRSDIIVDPKYYDIAAEVYERMKKKIHSAGIVNVGKLMKERKEPEENSLAFAVSSKNQFAGVYAEYLLGRVICCEEVAELKQHSIAITKDCMKYQGHVLRKIPEAVYRDPMIGQGAVKKQLENAEREYVLAETEFKAAEEAIHRFERIAGQISACNFDSAGKNLNVYRELEAGKEEIRKEELELAEARKEPTLIELNMKYDAACRALETVKAERERIAKQVYGKERDLQEEREKINGLSGQFAAAEGEKERACAENFSAAEEARENFEKNLRSKSAQAIAENYSPRRETLRNQREKVLLSMTERQAKYKDGDFGTGMEVIPIYREDYDKLVKSDLIAYEDRLARAQEDCEVEFRENFLAKMRENIEHAQNLFDKLNRSLKGVYYGNDSYKFELSANKERQSLYDMITSEINIAGQTLFSSMFETRYHAEMEDLFSRLTDENLNDTKVIEELTDYRSYLDYDIQVISKDGRMQRFSKTYGEKSGGETQTPYYVAIAASFAQMYSGRETARIIMLDEAFNNMDEDRIESMMKFLRDQNFQIILAAPPARMETIGEYVDSIHLAIRRDRYSIIEEYDL